MKKWIVCLLMVCLMLCGCEPEGNDPVTHPSVPEASSAALPTETTVPVPTLLENARPWGTEGELLELDLELTDREGDISCAGFGENILFWQLLYGEERPEGLRLWLLDVASGQVTKEYTHPLTEWMEPQIQSDRVCIADWNSGTVTILDADLEITKQWNLESDWHRWFMGTGDRLYIEMEGYLLERDLSTGQERRIQPEGTTSLYVDTFSPTGVTLTCYREDDERWNVAYLDFVSGEILRAPFRGLFDTSEWNEDFWLCRRHVDSRSMRIGNGTEAWDVTTPVGVVYLIDGGWLLRQDGEYLCIYESPGYFRTSCSISQGGRYYVSGEPVWVGELDGFVMVVTDMDTSDTTVLFWPMGIGSGADLEMTGVDLTLTAEEEMAQLQKKADALEDAYGLEIRIGTDCETEYPDFTAEYLTEPDFVKQQLEILESVLAAFPEGFIRQLSYENYEYIEIQLVSELTARPHYGTGSAYAGFVQPRDDCYLMVIDGLYSGEGTYFHEFSHIIDSFVEWDSWMREDALFSFEGWDGLNPEGFEYAWDYAQEPMLTEAWDPYFVDGYAAINPTEDRARVFEYACTPGGEWMLEQKPGVVEKMRYYAACIRDAFDTTGWPEELIWEQYL